MFQSAKINNKYYRYLGLMLVISSGIVSILGTGGDGDGGTGTPQTITSVSPAQSSDGALVTAVVTAQFGIDMDGGSIDASSFTLFDDSITAVNASSISYDVGSKVATFQPSADLTSGTEYTATITTAVQDAAGNNPLSTDYVWSFSIAPTIVSVSKDVDGVFGTSPSSSADIDQTGRYVVFVSINNLAPGINTGGLAQVFRKDTLTGEVRMVSTDSTGLIAANGVCALPRISDDGRYVVFDSPANNLDTNIASGGIRQVYRKDMQTGAISILSQATATTGGNGASSNPDISGDGRYVSFTSSATNLDTSAPIGRDNIYRAYNSTYP